jgi:general secretion pathway protein G
MVSAMTNMKRLRAFTLIELLIVMSIVGLLLTIAVPRYFGSVDKSKEVALRENLQVLRTGIDRFYADKGIYPGTLADLVTHKYFRKVPMDPITESSTTWLAQPSPDLDKPGVADVRSGAKGKTREGVPYEQL